DGGAVGGHGERARTVAEELDDGRGRARVGRIEDPDVGAPDAGGRVIAARARVVLAAVGGGDEGALRRRAGEDDVARLVADEQGVDDARRVARDVDDGDAVREVVDDPDPRVVLGGDGDGREPDRDGGDELG